MKNNSFVYKIKNFDIKKNIKVVTFAVLAVVLVTALVITTLFLSSNTSTSTNTRAGTSDEATLVWTPASATATSGATFTANIKMRFTAPHTVQGYQIKLNFDNTKLTATNIIYKGSASYVNGVSDANDTTNGYATLSRVNTRGYMLLYGAVPGNGWDIDPSVDGDVLILSLTFLSKSSAQSQLLVDPSLSPSTQAKVIFAETSGSNTIFRDVSFVVDQPFMVNPGSSTTAPVTTTPIATTVATTAVTTTVATTTPITTTVKTSSPVATTIKTSTPTPSTVPTTTVRTSTIGQTTAITQTTRPGTTTSTIQNTTFAQSSTPETTLVTDTSIPDTSTIEETTAVETTTSTVAPTPAATTVNGIPDAVLWLILILLITIPALAIATIILWLLKRKSTTPPTPVAPITPVPPVPTV